MALEAFVSSLTRTTTRFLSLVFTFMVLLFVLTGFLTSAYHREKHDRAERQFEAAEQRAASKHYDEAIDHYAAALRLSRDNPQYKQALALALVEAGRPQEAEGYLIEVARDNPSNGPVNLALARIHSARGDTEGALEYYQRAVYGIWLNDPVGNRVRVHFELIEWLASQGENMLVKAESLRLLDEVQDDPPAQARIGHIFLRVQAPEEARTVFSGLVSRGYKDCGVYAGLGDAEFDLAHYVAARSAYQRALNCKPTDLQSQLQLERASEIVSLDPRARGLGIRERITRSRQLIARTLAALETCIGGRLETFPQQFRDDVEQARLIVEQQRQRLQDDVVDSNIALAERLHRARAAQCGSMPQSDETLPLVLKELAE